MRLTSFTDYSMRVLMYAAVNGDRLTSIKEISQVHDISSNHLMKVVHRLGKAGYLETVRGKNGGLRLGRKAEDITVGEVIRCTEDDLKIVECMGDEARKSGSAYLGNCNFGGVMSEALDAFLSVADGYTVADMVKDQIEGDFDNEQLSA